MTNDLDLIIAPGKYFYERNMEIIEADLKRKPKGHSNNFKNYAQKLNNKIKNFLGKITKRDTLASIALVGTIGLFGSGCGDKERIKDFYRIDLNNDGLEDIQLMDKGRYKEALINKGEGIYEKCDVTVFDGIPCYICKDKTFLLNGLGFENEKFNNLWQNAAKRYFEGKKIK